MSDYPESDIQTYHDLVSQGLSIFKISKAMGRTTHEVREIRRIVGGVNKNRGRQIKGSAKQGMITPRLGEDLHARLTDVLKTTGESINQCVIRLIEQALPCDKPAPEPGSQWKHKNGTVYTVVAVTDPSPEKPMEFPQTVIYMGPDGKLWPRTLPRWYASMTPL